MENILLDLIPILSTVFLSLCYIPQIIKIYKTKNVESQSLLFWVLLSIALGLLWTNAFMIFNKFGTYGYLITETFNLGLALVVLAQVIKYKKKDVEND